MIQSIKQLATKAHLEYLGKDTFLETISINSKNIRGRHSLFVAIIANRDGHEFITEAINNGAKVILVSKKQNLNIAQIICNNTINGLRALAKEYCKSLKMPIIFLTGTCGKTSVKEMIVAMLINKNVHFTKGNFNNYLGVPITLLETPHNSDYLIIEVGASVIGEIKAATNIVKPYVGIITNIGACHLENFKNEDGVMLEKGEILKSVTENGCCIINLDDNRISKYAKNIKCKKITCSIKNATADILLLNYQMVSNNYIVKIRIFNKIYDYKLLQIGKHNIFNSILAIASIIAININPEIFLKNTINIKNYNSRFSTEYLTDKLILIDDTYNASVSSVKVAIEDLSIFKGRRIIVITSVYELGDKAKFYHKKIGRWLKNANLDNIFLFGDKNLVYFILKEYSDKNIKYYNSKYKLNNDLNKILDKYKFQKTKLIIKGARIFKMEDIVFFIKQKINTNK